MEAIYSISDLSFAYKNDNPVFSSLTTDVPQEGLMVISGNNGSGKTTLCRLLTGLTKGFSGSLLMQGEELTKKNSAIEEVLYIKQDLTGSLMGVTPDEDLHIWQSRFIEYDSPDKKRKRKNALSLLGLKKLSHTAIWDLSYGQKRRTMLSVLPLFMNKFWILDEPTASLDQEGIMLLLNLLQKKKESCSGALVLTHRAYLFAPLTNNFHLLAGGKIRRISESIIENE